MSVRSAPIGQRARAAQETGVEVRPAERAVTRLAVLQVRRGTAVVAAVAALLPAVVVLQYRGLDTAIGAGSLTVLAENPAIRTLFGAPVGLDDAGGFTVWRTGTVLAVLVGVWAALAATRVTRGEEEAGRWDLLLAGRVGLPAVVLRHLAVLLAAAGAVGGTVVLALLGVGTPTTGALLFGACIAGTGMVGAGLGVLAGQLCAERRTASGLAVGTLLAGLLTRMVADGVPALDWLHWLSPFGLLGVTAPFTADRPTPVLVLAAAVAGLGLSARQAATGRDVRSGRFPGRDTARWRRRPLTSLPAHPLPALAARAALRPTLGWAIGLAVYFLLIGVLARSMTEFLQDNPRFADLAAQAGFAQLGSVEGYVAALFGLLAVPLGAFAASRMAAVAADEDAGRLTLLYSRPVSRLRWVAVEALVGVVAIIVLAGVVALATWAGAAAAGAGLRPGAALAGALNVLPIALLCLGAALLALGWAPEAVLPLGVLPAAGGYLLLVLSDSFGWPALVRGASPFAHLAGVPAQPWDGAGALGTLVAAVVLGGVGVVGYRRRDLRG